MVSGLRSQEQSRISAALAHRMNTRPSILGVRGLQKPLTTPGDLSSAAPSILKLGSPKSVTVPKFFLSVGWRIFLKEKKLLTGVVLGLHYRG